MAYKCDPNKFSVFTADSLAVQRYFRHVMAAENLPMTEAYFQYHNLLQTYMGEHKIESENRMNPEQWKAFSTLFAEKAGLGKYSNQISQDILSILQTRRSVLETLAEPQVNPKEPVMDFVPMMLIPVLEINSISGH